MTDFDYAASLESDSARIVAALEANREAPIPWCGDWTVQECVRHIGGLHHVVGQVIEGRPTANFGLFKTLGAPKADDPALGEWLTEGTAALAAQVRSVPADAACWSFYADNQTVGFWQRRSAQETIVHRWDVERAAGTEGASEDPALAADGVDEYLDYFLGMMRAGSGSPGAGETVHMHCTDTDGEWFLTFPTVGERLLTREHAKGDVAFRGPAAGLLLFVWGRLTPEEAGLQVIGDASLASRWRELSPAI